MKHDVGRHVYGAAAILFGVVAIIWHDLKYWDQLQALGSAQYRETVVYVAAIMQLAGGIAIQWRRTARFGAAMLGVVYLFFALLWVPRIIEAPQIYDRWANFFEQFAVFLGAPIVYAASASNDSPWAADVARIGRILFGICVVSFALEQVVHLDVTAAFVPKWIPPNQMFWAILTTVAFGLAAVAILVNRQARLAMRLMTLMLALFGVLVWVPHLIAHPKAHFNWSECALTFLVTGAAWTVADLRSF